MVMIYGCGMSDSNAHSPLNVPVLVLGGGDRQDRKRGVRIESAELARLQLRPEVLWGHYAIACMSCASTLGASAPALARNESR